MVFLKTILSINNAKFVGNKKMLPTFFNYICIDSRKANELDFFVAINGENFDAHHFIDQIIKAGTKLIVVNKDWFENNGTKFQTMSFLVVDDTILALGQIAKAHRQSLNTKVIAIGGSNGKTSTKEMLFALLSTSYNTLKTLGNLNNHIGVPLTLLRLKKEHDFAIIEVGCNHFNEIKYLCEIAYPNYGLITNIGKEHLEFFKTKAGVAKAELELFKYLNQVKNTTCFVNFAESLIKTFAIKNIPNKKIIAYNSKNGYSISLMGYTQTLQPIVKFNLKEKTLFNVTVNSFGKPAIYNASAVLAIAKHLKINDVNCIIALSNFKSDSSKRMEMIDINGITFINDCYNSNPDSVILGLDSLHAYNTNASKYIVFGDMLELGTASKAEHIAIGKYMKKLNFKNVYLFGSESKNTHAAIKSFYYTNKEKMAQDLLQKLRPGDIVYVKGSRGVAMEEVTNYIKEIIK